MPSSPVTARPSRAYWAACAGILTVHALIGWFILLIYDGWASSFADSYPSWIAAAGLWFLVGILFMPQWFITRQKLLLWIFALQTATLAAIWARQGWMLQLYWEQRVAGPPVWYYLSAAAWLAMLLHLWLRARRAAAGGR